MAPVVKFSHVTSIHIAFCSYGLNVMPRRRRER